MTVLDAMERLRVALRTDSQGRYQFACKKLVLFVRLLGVRAPVRFVPQDRIAFRLDDARLTVEDIDTCAVRRRFYWDRIESVVAGEPESDNSDLFQG